MHTDSDLTETLDETLTGVGRAAGGAVGRIDGVANTTTADLRTRQWIWRAVVMLVLVAVGSVVWSIGQALSAPGTDSVSARLAEWARGHGLSRVVDVAERITYKPPKVGGTPSAKSPLSATSAPAGGATASRQLIPVTPIASPPLAGEGHWQVLRTVHGRPALAVAYLRPDAVHTSYVSAIAWMDPRLLRFVMHPGTQEPGGYWSEPTYLSYADHRGLVAAFNSGFRLDAARGGYYADGRTRGYLRNGAAALVIRKDGVATVGQWGRDVSMTRDVAAVRQNLDLLVDHGHVVTGIDTNRGARWGATLGNKNYVWRSGIGVTRTGALVYVAGNRLSAESLAELLRRGGAVRAMELDINPEWTSFVRYSGTTYGANPVNLLPDMQRRATRYDRVSTRDFFAVYAR